MRDLVGAGSARVGHVVSRAEPATAVVGSGVAGHLAVPDPDHAADEHADDRGYSHPGQHADDDPPER